MTFTICSALNEQYIYYSERQDLDIIYYSNCRVFKMNGLYLSYTIKTVYKLFHNVLFPGAVHIWFLQWQLIHITWIA